MPAAATIAFGRPPPSLQAASVFPQFLPNSHAHRVHARRAVRPLARTCGCTRCSSTILAAERTSELQSRAALGQEPGDRWRRSRGREQVPVEPSARGHLGSRRRRPVGGQRGSYARYVMAMTSNVAASTTAAGNASTLPSGCIRARRSIADPTRAARRRATTRSGRCSSGSTPTAEQGATVCRLASARRQRRRSLDR